MHRLRPQTISHVLSETTSSLNCRPSRCAKACHCLQSEQHGQTCCAEHGAGRLQGSSRTGSRRSGRRGSTRCAGGLLDVLVASKNLWAS